MKISDIIINSRTRRDLGDIKSLADSIGEIGLINPITVYYDEKMKPVLIAGYRRIKAFELLKRDEIPARPFDINKEEMHND